MVQIPSSTKGSGNTTSSTKDVLMSGGPRKPSSLRGTVPWRLLIFSFLILGIVVLFWAGLSFGYAPYLESKISDVDSELQSLSASLTPEQQKGFTVLYSQLYNINQLSHSHYYASKFFDFIEAATYQTVLLNSTGLDVKKGEANISGITTDFSTLTDQIASYRNYPGVSNVLLNSSSKRRSAEGGGISFSLKVIFDKGFFNSK